VLNEETKNMFIVVGGSIGMFLVLFGGFSILCLASWAMLMGLNWAMVQFGYPPPFGGEQGPAGLEILLSAFLLLSLRRLTRIVRPDD
jgi:hypothetical protein